MKYCILIVDKEESNREHLKEVLEDEYDILEAGDGTTALDIVTEKQDQISAILLELAMPIRVGFEIVLKLFESKVIEKVPVLVISDESNTYIEKKCFDYGVYDFVTKPFNEPLLKRRIQNMISQYAYKNQLEEKVQEQTAILRKAYETLQIQAGKLEKRNEDIIEMLGTIIEYRNLESGEHIQRVKDYTRILAENLSVLYPEYGLKPELIETIVAASALHDLGKITIPDSILLKPGRLTKEEFEYMKSHTIRGCEILESVRVEWSKSMKKISMEIIRHHHERYDGKGYPDGLKGDDIPISAQLVSLADVYDALINERCYKDAFSKDEAFRMIVNGECGVFSPKLMETFRNVKEKMEKPF